MLLSVLSVLACGGDDLVSPTAATNATLPDPFIPAGTVLTVVSGETGQPVTDTAVLVHGKSYRTNQAGQLTLPEEVPREAFLDLIAPDFLDRQTLLRSLDERTFSLWPKRSRTGLDERFTQEIAYTSGSTGEQRSLYRLKPGVTEAFVAPSPDMRADVVAMRVIDEAVAMITDITHGEIVFRVSPTPPPGAVSFELVIDPNDSMLLELDAAAIARRQLSSWAITGGTVVYASMRFVRSSTTAHELGHMFGLGHSSGPKDLMNTQRNHRLVERFSEREELAMRLMLQRRPGNRHPDNDRRSPWQISTAAAISTIACVH